MPCLSNVNIASIDADGASELGVLLPAFLGLLVGGVNAEERTLTIASVGQLVVMLSGKRESSNTRTSDSERSPNVEPEDTSSFFLISPKPSALPVGIDILARIKKYF